jgi:hypothetical protein
MIGQNLLDFGGLGLGGGLYDSINIPSGAMGALDATMPTLQQSIPTPQMGGLQSGGLQSMGGLSNFAQPSPFESTMRGLGYGGMALSGLGNLYSANKGIQMMEDQNKLNQQAYAEDERRRKELEQLNF